MNESDEGYDLLNANTDKGEFATLDPGGQLWDKKKRADSSLSQDMHPVCFQEACCFYENFDLRRSDVSHGAGVNHIRMKSKAQPLRC